MDLLALSFFTKRCDPRIERIEGKKRILWNFYGDHSFAYYELNTLGGIEMVETVVNHTDLSENAYKY